MTDTLPTEARHASLEDLVGILNAQHDAKLDAVVPASAIGAHGGVLYVEGMGPDGPAGGPGLFRPTEIADTHLAEKLGIPIRYLRSLRAERLDLYDANVNGWLQGSTEPSVSEAGPDGRRFLVRAFTPADPGGEGIFRAFLSDSYKRMDNLDVLTAALSGVRETGTEVQIVEANLSESRMRVRLAAPDVTALAPVLLERYISPTGGWTPEGRSQTYGNLGDQPPIVFGGFDISNSETGGSAFTLTPVLTVAKCTNGLKFTSSALRAVHLGGRLAEGQVRWSDDTQRRNVELVTSMAADAVATFLDADYVAELLRPIEEKAGKVLADPAKAVEVVSDQLAFSETTRAGVLSHFMRSGQPTAGGVLNAVTSFAQTVDDAELADLLESEALKALEVAASV